MIDYFAALRTAASSAAIHNVTLRSVKENALSLEYAGRKFELHGLTGGKPGEVGYVTFSAPNFRFRPYIDQSLRRLPELDLAPYQAIDGATCCWSCKAMPGGFYAPPGLIPGPDGRFIKNQSKPISLDVPPEFVLLASDFQLSPEELLRSFIGDLCGIENPMFEPRADGYGNNGSDECDMARQWLDRAHEGLYDPRTATNDRQLALRDQRLAEYRDEIGSLIAQYELDGGSREDILDAVRKFVSTYPDS